MRTFHPVAFLMVICFWGVIVWYGMQNLYNSFGDYSAEVNSDNPRAVYHARLEAQEAERQAAVERRNAQRKKRQRRGW